VLPACYQSHGSAVLSIVYVTLLAVNLVLLMSFVGVASCRLSHSLAVSGCYVCHKRDQLLYVICMAAAVVVVMAGMCIDHCKAAVSVACVPPMLPLQHMALLLILRVT
jgi:hypothetical protein